MKLIDTTKQFTEIKTQYGSIFYNGTFHNYTINEIVNILKTGTVPVDVRGNFALFCNLNLDKPFELAMVDHFASKPLYVTDKNISPLYYDLINHHKVNEPMVMQLRLLGGYTVGTETVHHGIRHIPSGHYYLNDEIISYLDITDLTEKSLDISSLTESLLLKMKNAANIKSNNVLHLSGGKDSTTLLGAIKELEIEDKFTFMTLYSDKNKTNENPIVKQIEAYYNINVEYVKCSYIDKTLFPEISKYTEAFWIENTYNARHYSAEVLNLVNDTMHWSGDVHQGLGLHGQHIIDRYENNIPTTNRDIAIYHMNYRGGWRKINSYDIDAMKNLSIHSNHYKWARDTIVDFYTKRLDNQTNASQLNKWLWCRLLEDFSSKCYPGSQDPLLSWYHPFADWDFCSNIIRSPVTDRISNGKDKLYFLKMFPNMYDISWYNPKKGLGIPALFNVTKDKKYANRLDMLQFQRAVTIKEIDFETILNIWNTELWPNRESEIKPMSSIVFGGGYNMDIYNYIPKFWGAYRDDHLIGVNSGFQTSSTQYRSRGIWIHPDQRRYNIATLLMEKVEEETIKANCKEIWSMPRKSAIEFYKSFGYVQEGEFFDEGVEFGPNCYVKKAL